MEQVKYPTPVDLTKFGMENTEPQTLYGLPTEVKYCKMCVISNQRPNSAVEYNHTKESKKETIHFDEDGICDACKFTERKRHEIDWKDRDKQLRELCDKYRKNDGSYDCIVPGSGGKDSFYASHILKTQYGMHPLTVTWAPHVYTDWGWKNFQSWIHAGHDMTHQAVFARSITPLKHDEQALLSFSHQAMLFKRHETDGFGQLAFC